MNILGVRVTSCQLVGIFSSLTQESMPQELTSFSSSISMSKLRESTISAAQRQSRSCARRETIRNRNHANVVAELTRKAGAHIHPRGTNHPKRLKELKERLAQLNVQSKLKERNDNFDQQLVQAAHTLLDKITNWKVRVLRSISPYPNRLNLLSDYYTSSYSKRSNADFRFYAVRQLSNNIRSSSPPKLARKPKLALRNGIVALASDPTSGISPWP